MTSATYLVSETPTNKCHPMWARCNRCRAARSARRSRDVARMASGSRRSAAAASRGPDRSCRRRLDTARARGRLTHRRGTDQQPACRTVVHLPQDRGCSCLQLLDEARPQRTRRSGSVGRPARNRRQVGLKIPSVGRLWFEPEDTWVSRHYHLRSHGGVPSPTKTRIVPRDAGGLMPDSPSRASHVFKEL